MGICIIEIRNALEIRNASPPLHIVSYIYCKFSRFIYCKFSRFIFCKFYIVSSIHLVGEEHVKTFYITHTFWLGCLNLEHWNPPARAFTYYTRPQVAIKGRECHLLSCHEWGVQHHHYQMDLASKRTWLLE